MCMNTVQEFLLSFQCMLISTSKCIFIGDCGTRPYLDIYLKFIFVLTIFFVLYSMYIEGRNNRARLALFDMNTNTVEEIPPNHNNTRVVYNEPCVGVSSDSDFHISEDPGVINDNIDDECVDEDWEPLYNLRSVSKSNIVMHYGYGLRKGCVAYFVEDGMLETSELQFSSMDSSNVDVENITVPRMRPPYTISSTAIIPGMGMSFSSSRSNTNILTTECATVTFVNNEMGVERDYTRVKLLVSNIVHCIYGITHLEVDNRLASFSGQLERVRNFYFPYQTKQTIVQWFVNSRKPLMFHFVDTDELSLTYSKLREIPIPLFTWNPRTDRIWYVGRDDIELQRHLLEKSMALNSRIHVTTNPRSSYDVSFYSSTDHIESMVSSDMLADIYDEAAGKQVITVFRPHKFPHTMVYFY